MTKAKDKAVKYSTMAMEIKKEYLMQHLENVKSLIQRWTSECYALPPFERQGPYWGWQAVYQPAVLQVANNNHILRRHLRSRALWSHYANWEQKLQGVGHLANQVRHRANVKYVRLSKNTQRQYTQDFLDTALWQGFKIAYGERPDIHNNIYRIADNEKGIAFGAYHIETSATSPEACSLVEKEHQDFIYYVARLKEMKDLATL